MTRSEQVGFSQRIRLEWLEFTANLVLAGSRRSEIVAALGDRLRAELSVGNEPERGNRDKAITILTKVWVTVPGELRPLRDDGLDLLQRLSGDQRMLVHWCMCMAAYPFFGAVADATGRLLQLQGTVGAAQVQRRLREQMGERETVARAARRILRAFIDWGVLLEREKKGFYRFAPKRVVDDLPLSIWAISAMFAVHDAKSRSATSLLRCPHLFPFDVGLPSPRDLEANGAFEVARYGFDQEVLVTRSGAERGMSLRG